MMIQWTWRFVLEKQGGFNVHQNPKGSAKRRFFLEGGNLPPAHRWWAERVCLFFWLGGWVLSFLKFEDVQSGRIGDQVSHLTDICVVKLGWNHLVAVAVGVEFS